MSFKVGDRVNVYGRPWGKSFAKPKWRYGTIAAENLSNGRRYPVAPIGAWADAHPGQDYTGQAFLIRFTPGGGAIWYLPSDLKPVKSRTKSNPKRKNPIGDTYVVTHANPSRSGGRRYRMGPNGEEPVWASKSSTAQMGREEAQRAARSGTEPVHYGNMVYDRASAEEYHRLTGRYPKWHVARSNPPRRVGKKKLRKNHWLLPMAVGAGATLAVQKLARKNPGRFRVVKWASLSDTQGKTLRTFGTLAAAQAYHKRLVLKGGKLRPDYQLYGIEG